MLGTEVWTPLGVDPQGLRGEWWWWVLRDREGKLGRCGAYRAEGLCCNPSQGPHCSDAGRKRHARVFELDGVHVQGVRAVLAGLGSRGGAGGEGAFPAGMTAGRPGRGCWVWPALPKAFTIPGPQSLSQCFSCIDDLPFPTHGSK